MKFIEQLVLNHAIENSSETFSASTLALKSGAHISHIEKVLKEFVKSGLLIEKNGLYGLVISF